MLCLVLLQDAFSDLSAGEKLALKCSGAGIGSRKAEGLCAADPRW